MIRTCVSRSMFQIFFPIKSSRLLLPVQPTFSWINCYLSMPYSVIDFSHHIYIFFLPVGIER